MGFFDFLKAKKVKEIKKIKLEEIPESVCSIRLEKEKEGDFLVETKNLIKELAESLKEKIAVLESLDLNEKKAQERVKLIVAENLNYYISHTKRLILSLEDLAKKDFEKPSDIIPKIDSVLKDFERKSFVNFEKSTFLIGEELGRVKKELSDFSLNFKKLIRKNSGLFETLDALSRIEEKLKLIHNLEETLSEIVKSVKEKDNQMLSIRKNILESENAVKKIKQSKGYSEELAKIKLLQGEKEALNKEAEELRKLIDFKKLANIYHSNKKEMEVIKEHQKDFQRALEADKGEGLITIVPSESKELISGKIADFIDKKKIIENSSADYTHKDKIRELDSEIERMNREIENLEAEKVREEKRADKYEEDRKNLVDSMNPFLFKLCLELR